MPDYRGRIHKEYKWEDLLEKLIHDFGDTPEVRRHYKDMENMMNPTGRALWIIHPW